MDMLLNLRTRILSEKDKNLVIHSVNQLPGIWLSVTNETDSLFIKKPGFIGPDCSPRAYIENIKTKNNEIDFHFTFILGEHDECCAIFSVPIKYTIMNGNVLASVSGGDPIPLSDDNFNNEIVKEIITSAEKK